LASACRKLRAGIQNKPVDFSIAELAMTAFSNSRTAARQVRSSGIVSTLTGALQVGGSMRSFSADGLRIVAMAFQPFLAKNYALPSRCPSMRL
jgi:hypothetical protein